jgi:hypothetical protein
MVVDQNLKGNLRKSFADGGYRLFHIMQIYFAYFLFYKRTKTEYFFCYRVIYSSKQPTK